MFILIRIMYLITNNYSNNLLFCIQRVVTEIVYLFWTYEIADKRFAWDVNRGILTPVFMCTHHTFVVCMLRGKSWP